MNGILMITWFHHRRTTEICEQVGIPLTVLATERRGILRYMELSLRTVRLLKARRPDVVIVQNPSLIAALATLCLRPLLGYRVVMDAHNEAVQPYVNRSALVHAVSHWALRRADLTIVTNRGLAEHVTELGGRPIVLPDAIPTPPAASYDHAVADGAGVLVIATGAPDEPVAEIAAAARRFPDVTFTITGKAEKICAALTGESPPNVVLAGFVDEAVYWKLLARSALIIDLTDMEDCLVCGAYEAVAVETPMILSDNRASRALFGEVACLVSNRADDIAAGIATSLAGLEERRRQLHSFRPEYVRRWTSDAADLGKRLTTLKSR